MSGLATMLALMVSWRLTNGVIIIEIMLEVMENCIQALKQSMVRNICSMSPDICILPVQCLRTERPFIPLRAMALSQQARLRRTTAG